MNARMDHVRSERGLFRLGGGALLLGGLLAVLVNFLHPRVEEFTAAAEVQMIADSSNWLFVHYLAAWATAFIFVGFLSLGSYIARGGAQTWGRIVRGAAVGAATMSLLTWLVDGMAMKRLVDAGGPAAEAGAEISLALFTGTIGTTFGLAPLLFGLAMLATDTFDRWLGWLAVAGGAAGLLISSIHFLDGPSPGVTNAFFTIVAGLLTVWILAIGWRLWNVAGASATEPVAAERVAA